MTIQKIAITKQGKKFYIKDTNQDLHTQHGYVRKDFLKEVKDGQSLKTNTNKELFFYTPSFVDVFEKIKRNAQIIPLKDVGSIITTCGISKETKIVDAGAGSGALACFLAHLAKSVTTYDIRADFLKIVEHNKEFLNATNLTIKNKDIYDGIDEKNVDVITLDLPEPWSVIEHAAKALKVGGFIVSYSPSIPQVMDFVTEMKKNESFSYLKTIEIIEREWEFEARKVRPKSQPMGHSGFLSFGRRIR